MKRNTKRSSQERSLFLWSRTLEVTRWSLATVDEKLKSNGNNEVDVEKLGSNGGAKTDRCVKTH